MCVNKVSRKKKKNKEKGSKLQGLNNLLILPDHSLCHSSWRCYLVFWKLNVHCAIELYNPRSSHINGSFFCLSFIFF